MFSKYVICIFSDYKVIIIKIFKQQPSSESRVNSDLLIKVRYFIDLKEDKLP